MSTFFNHSCLVRGVNPLRDTYINGSIPVKVFRVPGITNSCKALGSSVMESYEMFMHAG